MSIKLRTGIGVDFHRLEEGYDLWIGGIKIPHVKGAVGHSDADVLLHAICDAMLGACSLGDIGLHFPDTDPAFKGIDSKILLQKTYELIKARSYSIVNIDSVVCLQKPKLRPFIDDMRKVISSILSIDLQDISIKATTAEEMGFVGREEGIMAYATVLLHSGEM